MAPRKKKDVDDDDGKEKKKSAKQKLKKDNLEPVVTFDRGGIKEGFFKKDVNFETKLYGREKEQNEIDEWLNKFIYKPKELDKFALFLEGPPGMGKTSMAIEIFEKYNFRYKEFNTSDVRTQGAIREILNKMCGTYNVLQMMYMKKEEPIGIILDEIDGLCNSTEKSAIQELITVIEKANRTHFLQHPIVCISNYSNEKKMMELKNVCNYILCENPGEKEFYRYLGDLEEKNGIRISENVKREIISDVNIDFRQLKVNFDTILSYCNKRKIKEVDEGVFDDVKISFKDQDIMLYDALAEIFTKKLTYDRAEKYFNYEAFMLPFLIHENVVYNIFRCDWLPLEEKLNKTFEVLTAFSQYDQIQNGIYEKQSWELSDICALLTSILTNKKMGEILDMKKDVSKNDENGNNFLVDNLPNVLLDESDDKKKRKMLKRKKKSDDEDEDEEDEDLGGKGDYGKLYLLKNEISNFDYQPRLKYSLLLNKISLYYTHKKIYQNLTEMSPLSTHDFRTIATLIYACFFEGKVNIGEIVDIFIENEIDPGNIESILRLGHFRNKKKFTNRMKNDFLEAYYLKKPKIQIEVVYKDKTKEELKAQRKEMNIMTEEDEIDETSRTIRENSSNGSVDEMEDVEI